MFLTFLYLSSVPLEISKEKIKKGIPQLFVSYSSLSVASGYCENIGSKIERTAVAQIDKILAGNHCQLQYREEKIAMVYTRDPTIMGKLMY